MILEKTCELMFNRTESERELIAGYFMGLAIDKAYRCSSYLGVGCVITSCTNHFIVSGAQRIGDKRHVISSLFDRVNDANTILYLTQEPYLLEIPKETELLNLLSSVDIKKIYIANMAPGEFAGRWNKIFINYGIETEIGVGADGLGLLGNISKQVLSVNKPWVSYVLFLDKHGEAVNWQHFSADFGFKTDLANLIANHSELILINGDQDLRKFVDNHYKENVFRENIFPKFIELADVKYSDSVLNKINEEFVNPAASALLMAASKRDFQTLEKKKFIDELVVYKSEKYCSDVFPEKLALLDNRQSWHLHDCSPLGDCLRYVYRTIKTTQTSYAH